MTDRPSPDPHPVPESAWAADRAARAVGRVQMFNASRPGGLDGWTITLQQYELLRECILETMARFEGDDGSVTLNDLVAEGQRRLEGHPAFPGGRLTNYIRFVTVDLEARNELVRVPGSSPQRVRRADGRAGPPAVL